MLLIFLILQLWSQGTYLYYNDMDGRDRYEFYITYDGSDPEKQPSRDLCMAIKGEIYELRIWLSMRHSLKYFGNKMLIKK